MNKIHTFNIGLLFVCLLFLNCALKKESQNKIEINCINVIEKLGNKAPEKLGECMEQKDKSTARGIRNFLIKKGYEVETEGELNANLKKAITQYLKDTGLRIHTVQYEMNNVFEIDEEKINQEFCTCVKKEFKAVKRN